MKIALFGYQLTIEREPLPKPYKMAESHHVRFDSDMIAVRITPAKGFVLVERETSLLSSGVEPVLLPSGKNGKVMYLIPSEELDYLVS